jgi:hypothetical protein
MTREHAQKLQAIALQIVKAAVNREKAINEVVAKRGLSYAALRQLRNAA